MCVEKERETKERVRGAMISRCNRYDLSHGVVAYGWWWWWPFVPRWTVNAKPRVSLAWPSRRPDHNAWSCRSQADHNHGDPTFPPSSSLLSSFTPLCLRSRAPFPVKQPACSTFVIILSLQRDPAATVSSQKSIFQSARIQLDRISFILNFSRPNPTRE